MPTATPSDELGNSAEAESMEEEPGPFAPSDLSIEMGMSDDAGAPLETSHVPKLVLREKVVIVGDASAGKTSLSRMFSSGGQDFPKNYVMTSSVELCVKEVAIPDTNAFVDLFLYDMAGQSVFNQRELGTYYWDDVSFIVCVFDVSSRKSFSSCSKWVQSVRSAGNDGRGEIPALLVANKTDLRDGGIDSRSEIDTEEALKYAREEGFEYFECSALLGRHVDRPFHFVAAQALQRHRQDYVG
mmetsp:Transcript_51710/g.155191  ORF Transcript_51710/g.155191 Transcript_51710/m.155191 type:complete len:242 (-) Transcript_51710:26-751(-)